jgi:hypothetical protein
LAFEIAAFNYTAALGLLNILERTVRRQIFCRFSFDFTFAHNFADLLGVIFLFFIDRVFQFSDESIFIANGLVGEVELFVKSIDLVLSGRDFFDKLEFDTFFLGDIKFELLFVSGKGVFFLIKNFLVLFSESMELVVVSFSLFFDEFLVFGDLTAERFDRDVFFEELVS